MKRVLVTGAICLALLLAACTPADNDATPLATDSVLGTQDVIGTEPGDLATEFPTEVMATEPPTEAVATQAPTTMATEALTPAATAMGTEPAVTPAATGEATTAPAGETQPSVLLSTEVTGSQIVDANGEPMGDVMELLVDETGAIEYVVFDATDYLMEVGGDPGTAATPAATAAVDATADPALLNQGIVAVPLSDFDVNGTMSTGAEINEEQVLVYQGTVEALADMSGFDVSVLDQDGFLIDTTGTGLDESFNGLIRVSEFSDFDLRNTADEDLGEVEDLVVDISQGKVTYGVVDFGGFLGIAEQTTAVPWDLFTIRQDGASANFVLDVTEETLEAAPTIDLGAWPSWTERIDGSPDWNPDWDLDARSFWDSAS